MGSLTDNVRRGFRRRRKPWQGGEVPEWWGLAQWAAVAAIGIVLLISGIAAWGGSSSGGGTGTPGDFPVRTGRPELPTPTPTDATSEQSPAPGTDNDFAALDPVAVALTGANNTAAIPRGALNVARAGALAGANGRWDAIPVVGGPRPSPAAQNPQAVLTGRATVADPAVTGVTAYQFTVGVDTDGTGPHPARAVKVTVERAGEGFAVHPVPAPRKRPAARHT